MEENTGANSAEEMPYSILGTHAGSSEDAAETVLYFFCGRCRGRGERRQMYTAMEWTKKGRYKGRDTMGWIGEMGWINS